MSEVHYTPEEIAAACRKLEGESPEAILRWAVEQFYPRLTMATAFGPEGNCIIHMLAEIEPRVRIFNLETGYQFAETLELRERIRKRYGIAVDFVRAEMTVAEYEEEHGGPLYVIRPDQCCHDRKTLPLRNAIIGYDAWISAIRSDQTGDRAQGVGRPMGRQVRASEDQSAAQLDQEGRVEFHHHATTCPTIRCTTRATRASVAGPAPPRSATARTNEPGAGAAPARKNAACTSSNTKTAAASEGKSEIRISKSETNSKSESAMRRSCGFEISTLNFGFVSDFEIRISDFLERSMRLSAKAQYACVAMVDLASSHADPNPVHLKHIADRHGISQRFLVQILLQLKGAGLVDSTRGASGGYLLAKAPSLITLADIVHAIDQPPPLPRRPSRAFTERRWSRSSAASCRKPRTANRFASPRSRWRSSSSRPTDVARFRIRFEAESR